MNELRKYIHFYIGCITSKGKFIGIRKDLLFIETEQELVEEYDMKEVGNTLFFYLKPLSDLTTEQSRHLIDVGLVIGRPHGYTFTNHSFLYLLSLSVDLFGLIHAGYAKDLKQLA